MFALKRGWRPASVWARPLTTRSVNCSWGLRVPVGLLGEIVGTYPIRSVDVVYAVKRYAKANHLLITPGDKIICDTKLKELFDGADTMELVSTKKYFRKYLKKPEELGGKAVEQTMLFLKSMRAKTKAHASVAKAKRMSEPMQLSPELVAICGAQQLSRAQVINAVWSYAKANNLNSSRVIKCDEKLKRFAGVDKFQSKQLMTLMKPHLRRAL